MKKVLLTAFLLTFLGCGSKSIKDDVFPTSDYESKFESVFTSVGTESNFGTAVYQMKDTKSSLKIYTLLSGSYEIKSNSCNFIKNGRYTESQVISIPLSEIIKESAEKLCTVTIQVNPEYKGAKVEISPRYSIVYLQLTSRSFQSKSFQYPSSFSIGNIVSIPSVEKYRLIQNCVLTEPVIVKESTVAADINVHYDELNQTGEGSCYYSLVYTKNGIPSRYAFSISLYDPAHVPLTASAEVDGKKLEVVAESSVSICVIGDEYKLDNRCKGNAKDGVLIQVHSNRRSYYNIWRK